MKRSVALCSVLPSAVLCGVLAVAMTSRGGTVTVNASNLPISHSVPDEYATSLKPFNLRFVEGTAGPGQRPTLTDGRTGISDQEAVAAALAVSPAGQNGALAPGVQVAARFGVFSDDAYATRLPTGQMEHVFQERTVWIVTFYGPGVLIPSRGLQPLPPKHVQNMVIDAATGAWMESFS